MAEGPKTWDLGTVVIAGDPTDEIAEVWYDVSSLAIVLAALGVLALATLYVVLGRMLDPMANVARGLTSLEDGDYATRLTPPRVKELGTITACFNRLAETLGRTRAENGRLYGQLITVQEDERREIANELHDEASPCLFGIMANAMSVQKLTERRRDSRSADIRGHASEILRVTERLKMMNRVMLKKLRPVSIGRIALSDRHGPTERAATPLSGRRRHPLHRNAGPTLRRGHRSDHLSLHSRGRHQRHPPRQGGHCSRGPLRKERCPQHQRHIGLADPAAPDPG